MQFQSLRLENLASSVPGLVLWIGVCILLFLLVREILTWYWKQNRIVSLLEEIRDTLKYPESVRGAAEPRFADSTALAQPFSGAMFAKVIGGIILAVSLLSLLGGEFMYAAIGCVLAVGAFLIALRLERKGTETPTEP